MRLKNKFAIIIVVLGIITFMRGVNPLEILSNHKETYLSKNNLNNKKYLVLVNKNNSLELNYKPENLVKPNIEFLSDTDEESRYMEEEASKELEKLFEAAKEENIKLIGSSAYRSYKNQVSVLMNEIKSKGVDYANSYVAKPGKSEHQTGLSIDVTNEARAFDKTTSEAQWLANNAHRFGFILRYPEGKEDITGYKYEPWHIRYVGKDSARDIYNNNTTLEEYLNNMV